MDKRKDAVWLYGLGYSIRQIAEELDIPKSTVHRWIQEMLAKPKTKPKTKEERKEELLQDEIWDRILELLKFSKKEKGRTRTLSISRIYERFKKALEDRGIESERTFRRRLEEVVKQRFGSWEKLELERRDKKEYSEYRTPKGKQKRERGEWEIDSTGYNWKGERYFILAVRERWSGAFLGYLEAKAREDTQAQHYNKAFNSLDLARFLISLFREYGLPERIITDNEAVLKAEIIVRGLEYLKIPVVRTRPYSPNQKLIERAFRDLKDYLRYYSTTHKSFEEALRSAVEMYNKSEHKFEHFQSPIIPEVLHSTIEYRQFSEDELVRAFRERFVRTIRNNTIRIENLVYEFIYPVEERAGEIGRTRKSPEVVCYRDLENATYLEVWDEKERTPLGFAKLISTDAPSLDPTEIREIKNKEKRIERRKRKLKEELLQIEQEEIQLQELQQQPTTNFLELLSATEQSLQPAPQPQPEEEEWDPIKLFLGGEEP